MDAKLAAMAVDLHAVFPLRQLIELGLSASGVRKRAAAGRLHRVHKGVYSLVPPPMLTVRGRYRAAVLACGPTAALSHRSAADLQDVRACHRRVVEVLVPGTSTHRHPGIQVHRSIRLQPHDITTVAGIAVTTVARTALDLAGVVPRRGVERALDQAEIERIFDLAAILDVLHRNPGHPGAGTLRAALELHTAGTTLTWSQLEEALYAVTDAAGFARPEVNALVDLGDGGPPIRPRLRVACPEARRRDRRRADAPDPRRVRA